MSMEKDMDKMIGNMKDKATIDDVLGKCNIYEDFDGDKVVRVLELREEYAKYLKGLKG